MIQLGTIVKVADKTGVVLAQCIKVFSTSKDHIAYIGDVILVSIRWVNPKRLQYIKERRRKRFLKGSLQRALVIRAKTNFVRDSGIFMKFDENSVILVSKSVVPLSNRLRVPYLKKFVWSDPQ